MSAPKAGRDFADDDGSQGSGVSSMTRPALRPARPRVLMAEPDERVRKWLRRPLSKLTSDVSEATTGLELEAQLRQNGPFDLVITNASLQAPSGLQVLARARAQGSVTPFIVVTSINQALLRVFVSDAEGTVLSSRVVDSENLGVLVGMLVARSASNK
jgi:DNA-binding response OmpR family regulator